VDVAGRLSGGGLLRLQHPPVCPGGVGGVLAAATASDSEGRGRYLAAWIATLLTCAGIWLAAASVPVQYQGPLELHLDVMARRMRYAEATLCLVLSPAMALTLLARWRR
jgi:hypothetical protein